MYDAPKVINLFGQESYHNKFPQLMMMSEQTCFVRMLRYDITIPIRGSITDDFNMFERAVIKLAALGISSPEKVAETICIPPELADFIISRLKELDFIDRSGCLTNTGRKYLDHRDSTDKLEIMPAVIFAMESTGEFLPIVLTDNDFKYEDADFNGKQITVRIGTAGNAQWIKGDVVGASKKTGVKRSLPTQKELKRLLDDYNNLMHSMHRPKIAFYRDRMIEPSSPTNVFFLVKAALQRGNLNSLLCSEGMLINNDIIGKVLNTDYELKQKLTNAAAVTVSKDGPSEKTQLRRYEEILRNMPDSLYDIRSIDEQKETESIIKGNIPKIFAMMEHAFNYYLKSNSPSEGVIKMFGTQNRADNESVLINYLLHMGASMENCNTRVISRMDDSVLNMYFKTGVPNIYSVVPLAIAEAHENPASPVREMIKACPHFVDHLAELTNYAGEFRHGGEQKSKVSEKEYNNLFRTAKTMISSLLPDIEFGTEERARTDSLSDAKVRAISAVSNDIGAVCYYTLDTFVQNELLKTSSDKSDNELPIASDAVLSFCKIAERLLKSECDKFDDRPGSSKADALARLRKYTNGDIPEGLSCVSEKYICSAAARRSSTLGGLTLAYILKGNDESVSGFVKNGFHELVSTLAGYRAHANNVMLCLSAAKLKQLRQKVYDLIVFLGGNS